MAAQILRAKTKFTSIGDHYQVLSLDLDAVRAILDAAKVLTALERAPHAPADMATGEGFADGWVLHDATLPVLLSHAIGLVDMAINEADLMLEMAKSPPVANAEVSRG